MKRVLIKLGGSTLQEHETLQILASAVSKLWAQGSQAILVHGGGPAINSELSRRGITWSFLDGQRVTTSEMIDVITEVLENRINFSLIASLKNMGIEAQSFSGRDGMLLCQPASRALGHVGLVTEFRAAPVLRALGARGPTLPVIAPLGCDEAGEIYNVNADFAAAHIARALDCDEVWFLTDQPGILDAHQRPLAKACADDLENLIRQQIVTGGMLTKVRACLAALRSGPRKVRILKAGNLGDLVANSATPIGTLCEEQFSSRERTEDANSLPFV